MQASFIFKTKRDLTNLTVWTQTEEQIAGHLTEVPVLLGLFRRKPERHTAIQEYPLNR